MCIVDEHVAAKCASGVIVDAAGAVGDIAHYERFGAGTEAGQNI